MGNYKLNSISMGFSRLTLLLVLIISAVGCNDPVTNWGVDTKYMVMTEYVQEYDEFSEFGNMLERTRLYSLLNTRGPFTLFLPTNDAVKEMYDEIGVNSLDEFWQRDTSLVYDFVYNHIIGTSILTAEIGLGALRETNVLGDYIVSDFVGTEIRLNKKAIITDRDVPLSNGYINVIDKTIPIIDKSVYQTMKGLSEFSLFVEGLDMAGLSDTLDMIKFDYGNLVARNRYTIYAVPDSIFNRYGITNVNELVAYFTDDVANVKSANNPFYQFMVYHCMTGTYYLSDFPLYTSTFPVISQENHLSLVASDDYKLNQNPLDRTDYVGFNVPESNYPCKNGALHAIDDLLVPPLPTPVNVLWNVFDHLEITSGDWYVNYFKKWDDTKDENGNSIHFKNIVYQGDYLQYYYKGSSNPGWIKGNNTDGYGGNLGALNMLGFWWIEFTTPRIMKGKYEIVLNMSVTGNQFAVYVDGKKATLTTTGRPFGIGTFEFSETKTHKIKVVSLGFTTMFWRDIQFIVVN